jgi:hypothetical protein
MCCLLHICFLHDAPCMLIVRCLVLHVCRADGRDVPDGSSVQFTQSLKDDLAAMEAAHPGLDAKIASGGGRMHVTMDRYEVGPAFTHHQLCMLYVCPV